MKPINAHLLAFAASLILVLLIQVQTFYFATALAAHKSKCAPARELEMDSCAARMGFLGDHSFRVPKNATSMNKFCTSLKENIGCIQAYSKDCLQGFTKQILTNLLKRGKQQQASICGAGQARAEFISKMSACLPDEKINQFHSCMDASLARYEYISTQVASENRLPSLCCSYQIFFRDIEETLGQLCASGAGENRAQESSKPTSYPEVVKYVQKIVSGTTGEFIQLICDNHRSFDECRTSKQTRDSYKQLEIITKQAKQNKIPTKHKSLMPPLMTILESGPN